MVYAVLREGTTRKDADTAFDRLPDDFFDWNEVRVSSCARGRGSPGRTVAVQRREPQRVIDLSQEVFESTFSFDLESLAQERARSRPPSRSAGTRPPTITPSPG